MKPTTAWIRADYGRMQRVLKYRTQERDAAITIRDEVVAESGALKRDLETAHAQLRRSDEEFRKLHNELTKERERAGALVRDLANTKAELESEQARHRETFGALRIARRMIAVATERGEA